MSTTLKSRDEQVRGDLEFLYRFCLKDLVYLMSMPCNLQSSASGLPRTFVSSCCVRM
jgi:hypothetical protein